MLKPNDVEQITTWLEWKYRWETITDSNWYKLNVSSVPYTNDFLKVIHYLDAPEEMKKDISTLIDDFIVKKLTWKSKKTKTETQFVNFFNSYQDLFWEFRKLNEDISILDKENKNYKKAFNLWKKIDLILLNYQNALTKSVERSHPEGVDRIVLWWENTLQKFFQYYHRFWNEI